MPDVSCQAAVHRKAAIDKELLSGRRSDLMPWGVSRKGLPSPIAGYSNFGTILVERQTDVIFPRAAAADLCALRERDV